MTQNKRNVNFKGKDQYLQYRADWKRDYAKLSDLIRDFKFCRRYHYAQNKLDEAGLARYARVEKQYGSSWGFCPEMHALAHRAAAAAMLGELKTAKEEAQQQYLAERNLLAVTALNTQ